MLPVLVTSNVKLAVVPVLRIVPAMSASLPFTFLIILIDGLASMNELAMSALVTSGNVVPSTRGIGVALTVPLLVC